MYSPAIIIGILIGLLFGGWIGAFIGGICAYLLVSKLKLNIRYSADSENKVILELLFLALGKIAKSDGVVKDSHIQQARFEIASLNLDTYQTREAMFNFNAGKDAINFAEVFAVIKYRPDISYRLLAACWRMAYADGIVGAQEKQTLLYFGQILNVSVAQNMAIGREYQPRADYQDVNRYSGTGDYAEALRLLGVSAESSKNEIKRAYRKLVSKNHPDKLDRSASAAEIKRANDMTHKLNQAYQTICRIHGWD